MLAGTSSEMTGLDLATRPEKESSRRRSAASDEMLSTPKINETGVTLLSPRFHTFSSSSMSSSSASSKSSQHFPANKKPSDDLLMTPVLTTPSTADVWSAKKSPEASAPDFLPENLSTTTSNVMSPVEPPRDLPMDSDIGLRSPCAGLLAKRRRLREISKRTESFNSDSNSCDTPTSENSPHDLTTRKSLTALAELDNSRRTFHSSPRSNRVEQQSPTIRVRSFGSIEPSSPRIPSVLLPSPTPATEEKPEYQEFKRPGGPGMKDSELPAHYTPSPLAVPSPNWSAIERFMGKEIIKTPKNLDTPNVFDFLGLPPSTPRSAKMYRDLSPNRLLDYYSGREHLSPRLSPRFSLVETPTDLSARNKPILLVNDRASDDTESAEDLSTRPKSARSSRPPSPPQTPPMSFVRRTPPQIHHQVKVEYDVSPPPPAASVAVPQGSVLVPLVSVKSESSVVVAPPMSMMDNYDNPQTSTFAQPRSFPSAFYIASSAASATTTSVSGLHHDYHQERQIYSQPELNGPTPPPPHRSISPLSRIPYDRPAYQQQTWAGLAGQNFSSGGGLISSDLSSWTIPVKEEPSITPPPNYSGEDASMATMGSPVSHRKRNSRKESSEVTQPEEKRGRKKSRSKTSRDSDGTKRVYVCPHCQRSYDWNYNLNRHLKYECGKENAFQCAKCGRKFPHKQNCVYHLKRKHKVICETADQYITSGLVIFKGANHPTGITNAVSGVEQS